MRDIRKISIGPDYKSAFHYMVGQDVINGSHQITTIKPDVDGYYTIYVQNDQNEIFAWKSISSSVPVVVEYNIEF
jgi:hypothetical protein